MTTQLATCQGDCACGVTPLAYPKYSFGMLLEPSSLALEHSYSAMRLNTHDIRLHDFGTVCGLRVVRHPSAQCVNTYAILQPGIALDCCGREIVVPEPLFVPLEDGATSGWCGAAMGSTESTPKAREGKAPAKLYIYLRYAQCDTDPIPTYVRASGCCNSSCEPGDCTPSVTREGYEVSVSSTAPAAWTNPIGRAFCEWLRVKLNGPGASAPAHELFETQLDRVLCDVITAPCTDFCSDGNEQLLLASVAFNEDGTLIDIDNVTGRRLVIPTGAIFEALSCLTLAEIACCAATDAYLGLRASIRPDVVNIAAPPPEDSVVYQLAVTNTDAHRDSKSFEIHLSVSTPGLTFKAAELVVGGVRRPAPNGTSSGITASIAKLAAGKEAFLGVRMAFDPKALKAGATIDAVASIAEYAGDHSPDVPLTVKIVDKPTDGPRVELTGWLEYGTASTSPPNSLQVTADQFPLLQSGMIFNFTEMIEPATCTATTTTQQGSVTVALVREDVTRIVDCTPTWNSPTQLKVTAVGVLPGQLQGYAVRVTLSGGPKGGSTTGFVLRSRDHQVSLDGLPAFGKDPAGESGDGTQGGDFVVTIVQPAPPPS